MNLGALIGDSIAYDGLPRTYHKVRIVERKKYVSKACKSGTNKALKVFK